MEDGATDGDKEVDGDTDGRFEGGSVSVGESVGGSVGNAGDLQVPQALGHMEDTKVPSYTSLHTSMSTRKPSFSIHSQSRFFLAEKEGMKIKCLEL